jgi:hypothetical protein
MGIEESCMQGSWWGDWRKGDHLEDTGVDGKIIKNWIFKKWEGEEWIGLIWLRIGAGGRNL